MKVEKGIKVFSRDGERIGKTTGATRTCGLDGCGDRRIVVKWPDGRITYPCAGGMRKQADGSFRIV